MTRASLDTLIAEMNIWFESVIDSRRCTLRFAIVPDARNLSAFWKLFTRVDCIKYVYAASSDSRMSESVCSTNASPNSSGRNERQNLIELERYRYRLNEFRNVYNAIMSLVMQHTTESRVSERRLVDSNRIDLGESTEPKAKRNEPENHCDDQVGRSWASASEPDDKAVLDSVAIGELDDNRVCCVCMDRRTDIVLDCGHAYCQVCMDEWTAHTHGISVYECVQCRVVQSASDAWLLADCDSGSELLEPGLDGNLQLNVLCSPQFADVLTALPARFGSRVRVGNAPANSNRRVPGNATVNSETSDFVEISLEPSRVRSNSSALELAAEAIEDATS